MQLSLHDVAALEVRCAYPANGNSMTLRIKRSVGGFSGGEYQTVYVDEEMTLFFERRETLDLMLTALPKAHDFELFGDSDRKATLPDEPLTAPLSRAMGGGDDLMKTLVDICRPVRS